MCVFVLVSRFSSLLYLFLAWTRDSCGTSYRETRRLSSVPVYDSWYQTLPHVLCPISVKPQPSGASKILCRDGNLPQKRQGRGLNESQTANQEHTFLYVAKGFLPGKSSCIISFIFTNIPPKYLVQTWVPHIWREWNRKLTEVVLGQCVLKRGKTGRRAVSRQDLRGNLRITQGASLGGLQCPSTGDVVLEMPHRKRLRTRKAPNVLPDCCQ